MWNFKGTLWNSTQNILPIHWKIWCLYNIEILRALKDLKAHTHFYPPPPPPPPPETCLWMKVITSTSCTSHRLISDASFHPCPIYLGFFIHQLSHIPACTSVFIAVNVCFSFHPNPTTNRYHQTSNISPHQIPNLNVSHLILQVCQIHWIQVLSWEWRSSWSSADMRRSNYILVINNFIAN